MGGQALNKFFWKHPDNPDIHSAKHLAGILDIPTAGAKFLLARSISTPEAAGDYLFPNVSMTHDPYIFENMPRAVSLVENAVQKGKKILVHGDYDVDGISGTALLYQFLKKRVPDVKRFLPDRRKDGYGLSKRAVDWAAKNDVGLLIAVDCGTSDGALVEILLERGIETIICDHHEFPSDGVAKGVILNPTREGEAYPFKDLSGTGVAFKLVLALEKNNPAWGYRSGDFLDLMALATVGDLAPLIDENRYYVRVGLEKMNQNLRPGLKAIRDCSRLQGREITARHISFVFAPRLNAPGRVANAKPSLEILCAEEKAEAEKLGSLLERENERRKELTEIVQREVEARIAGIPKGEKRGGYVIAGNNWDEGVLGIAASRIVELTGKPAILLSHLGDLAKGSGRSIPGVNLKEQLDRCRRHLVKYGGHAQAVGLTIETDRLTDFEKELSDLLRETMEGKPTEPIIRIDADLKIEENTMELVEFLSMCEPFGLGNREPVWCIRGVRIDSRSGFVGNSHLKLFFSDSDGHTAEAISFNWKHRIKPEKIHDKTVDLAVSIHKGFYLERFYPEIRVLDIRQHEGES